MASASGVPCRHSPKELSPEREASWKEWLQQYRAALKEEGLEESERVQMQNSVNPCYIPRNHLLQEVIARSRKGQPPSGALPPFTSLSWTRATN